MDVLEIDEEEDEMNEPEHGEDHARPDSFLQIDENLRITSISTSCTWKDQGWGNQKSELFLCLTHQGEDKPDPATILSLWGIAPHVWKNEERVMDASDEDFKRCILDQQRPGDKVQVLYRVGGGGGHSIHIRALELKVQGDLKSYEFEGE